MKSPANDHQRALIAELAAQLIAEGVSDFHAAKLKAVKQLGFEANGGLPDNQQIEAALRQYHALFASDSQPLALAALRAAAIDAMQWLARFSPWLSGGVLTGSANEFSEIELEIVGAEPKSFEIFLMNEDVPFDFAEPPRQARTNRRRRGTRRSSESLQYRLEWNAAPLRVTLYESHAARLAAHPKGSLRHEREQLSAADSRIAWRDATDHKPANAYENPDSLEAAPISNS